MIVLVRPLLRISVTGLLLFLLARTIDLEAAAESLKVVTLREFATMAGLNLLAFFLMVWRWRQWLNHLELPAEPSRVLRGVFGLHFLSQVIPFPLAGEAGRMIALPPEVSKKQTFLSILLDRGSNLVGGAVAVFLSWVILVTCYPHPLPRALHWLPLVSLAGLASAFLLLRSHPRLRPLVKHLRSKASLRALLLSLAIAATVAVELSVAAAATGATEGVSILIIALTPSLSFLLACMPVSFADWGTREALALLIYTPLGLEEPKVLAASLLVGFTNLVCSLPGALALTLKR